LRVLKNLMGEPNLYSGVGNAVAKTSGLPGRGESYLPGSETTGVLGVRGPLDVKGKE